MQCHSPPTQSETSQPKTQATTTQEELTGEERPSTAGSNGHLHSVLPIIKTPSHDMYGHYPPVEPEPLGQKKTGLQRYGKLYIKVARQSLCALCRINEVVLKATWWCSG